MVIWVISTAKANRSGSLMKPGPSGYISQGMTICASTTMPSTDTVSTDRTSLAKRSASAAPSPSTVGHRAG